MARRACGSRPVVSFVEEHELRVVDEGQGDEQALFLASRQRHEPGVPLVEQPELFEKGVAVDRVGVERRPQMQRFPHSDALLELGLLKLDANAILELIDVSKWIEREDRHRSSLRCPKPFDTLHRRGLASAVGADEAEDLALPNLEGNIVDGNLRAVALADAIDPDDGLGFRHSSSVSCTSGVARRPGGSRQWS